MNQSLLIATVLAGLFYVFGQYITSQANPGAERTLSVQASGKAEQVPNLAYVTLGVQVEPQPTAEQASAMLATQGSAVLDAVKSLGIEEKDIAAHAISVQPTYDYIEGRQVLRGYQTSQQVEVTIRDTNKSGDVIAKATEAGANQIGGLSFKSDDSEAQQLAAEQDAIANARAKAEDLAKALGVRLQGVKYYNAQPGATPPIPYALEGRGGDTAVASPKLPTGTQETQVSVTITYEIR